MVLAIQPRWRRKRGRSRWHTKLLFGGLVSKCALWHEGVADVDMLLADNYSILLAYFTRQNGVDVQEIRRYLDIGEDYEDVY